MSPRRATLVLLAALLGGCATPPPSAPASDPIAVEPVVTSAPAAPVTTPAAPSAPRPATRTVPASRTATASATRTVPASPTATASATRTVLPASPTVGRTGTATERPTAETTVALSDVDATQVANATGTALAAASTSPTPAASASPTVPLAPTSAAPAPLPTATDGRYPKAQLPGFVVSVVANSAERPILHPTSLAWGPDGALYVSRMEGPIIRVAPDGTRTTFAEGFNVPAGLAFRPGTNVLYVAHRGGVTTLRDSSGDGIADERRPFLTGLPCCYAELHQTNGIQFGPDGWLYIAQGATSDHGEAPEEPWHAGILRAHPDQGQASLAYVATGVRNAYDLVVRPNGQIFATDNGADFGPPEELNHILPGADYGWPYCTSEGPGRVGVHPTWNDPARCEGTRAAIATFVPHASANGITSYEAGQFPAAFRGNLFVALWSHIADAYRIVRIQLTPNGESFTTTVTPFVTDLELPLDVAVGPDGALYIADWGPGRIYRVEWRP